MEPHDESPRIVDLIAAFGSKKLPSGKHKMNLAVATKAESESTRSPQDQRLAANGLRPTMARVSVLNALEEATPRCLDAIQVYRILSMQFSNLTPGSVYRALNDLWTAGLLFRTDGTRGRAFYAIKPQALGVQYDTLACYCGSRTVFIEDRTLHERLQSLASEHGFATDEESIFTIVTTCAKCRRLSKEGRPTMDVGRRSEAKQSD